MTVQWRLIPEKCHDHVLEAEGTDGSARIEADGSEQPIYNYHAYAKWDGCVSLSVYSNGYSHDHGCTGDDCSCCVETMHICDLKEFAGTLEALNVLATRYHAEQGYEAYWPSYSMDVIDGTAEVIE